MLKVYFPLILSAITQMISDSVEINYVKTKIWGPGLNAKSHLPSRYVYVELYTLDGSRLTTSAGKLEVEFTLASGGRFIARTQVIDRGDGSYIINYRPHGSMKDVSLNIKLKGNSLGKSPYLIKGWMHQENCNCPVSDPQEWLEGLQCPDSFDQLDEDLSPFVDVDMREVEPEVHRRWPKRPGTGALMHYVIKDNRVYRKEVGTICGFKIFSDAILLSLIRKVSLPDVEFFINLGDWPLVKTSTEPLPIFSWCGSNTTWDIILPTYDVTDSTMKSLSQVSLDMFTVQSNNSPRWSEKIPKALFRGRDSRKERLELVRMSQRGDNSKLVDAGITAFFFFPKDDALKGERIAFFDFFKYKYQLNIDGTVAAYRFPYLMAADSLVFKHDSPYYEYFYRELEPWTHYIPLKADLSDVIERVTWAIENDHEAERIALNGRTQTRETVTPANIYCYYYRAIQRYASRIRSKVEILDEMEEAIHPEYNSACECHREQKTPKHQEL